MNTIPLAIFAVIRPVVTLDPLAAIVAGLLLCVAAVVVWKGARRGR